MEMEDIYKRTEEEGLKVIGVGLPRTGTSSLRDALNILGFPCYHFSEMLKNGHLNSWIDICAGKSKGDWKSIYQGYTSTADYPSLAVYGNLIDANPEAKLILTVRDVESWYQSVNNTVYRLYKESEKSGMFKLAGLVAWEGTFQGRFEDKEYAISVYEAHVEKVKKCVPANKLLVFDVNEGWSPLCKFLGVPIPPTATPFPHSYKSAS